MEGGPVLGRLWLDGDGAALMAVYSSLQLESRVGCGSWQGMQSAGAAGLAELLSWWAGLTDEAYEGGLALRVEAVPLTAADCGTGPLGQSDATLCVDAWGFEPPGIPWLTGVRWARLRLGGLARPGQVFHQFAKLINVLNCMPFRGDVHRMAHPVRQNQERMEQHCCAERSWLKKRMCGWEGPALIASTPGTSEGFTEVRLPPLDWTTVPLDG